MKIKTIVISDTHGKHEDIKIEPCDLLIHAGDFTMRGDLSEFNIFNKWLGKQPAKKIVLTAGNHDFLAQENTQLAKEILSNGTLLIDEMIEVEGLKIYGSPWTPTYYNWAFMKEDRELRRIWSRIPKGLDILISHGPPKGILDKTMNGVNAGSETLFERCSTVCPRYHFFGHIHEGYGETVFIFKPLDIHGFSGTITNKGTRFINASTCDIRYKATNRPVVMEIHK